MIGVTSGGLEAPTVIANSEVPGSLTVADPGPELPLETTATTPAFIALLTAIESAERWLLVSEPSDKLMTSIPSSTARSIPAITSSVEPLP
ncbi:hypothetical protein D3C74_246450 [compost metagenome]